ncbi:hypothetical protein ACK86M_005066, partial [Salmonella enterica]
RPQPATKLLRQSLCGSCHPTSPEETSTRQAVATKTAVSMTENEAPTTTPRINASFVIFSDILTP